MPGRDTKSTVVDGPRGDHTVRCAVPVPGSTRPGLRRTADGEVEDRYEDEGEIARGGMGAVKKVLDSRILRHAAMKIFDRRAATRQDALRFLEEVQITGQLDHPNIVPVYDLTVDDDGMPVNFTMKLVRGHTLRELIDSAPSSQGPHSAKHSEARRLEKMLRIFVKTCEAVSFAHSRGVIHRDIKPSNIMVGAHGEVYVMDWGVARLRQGHRPSETEEKTVQHDPLRRSVELPGTVVGTVAYMAPEQADGDIEASDERTDVFGLGGLLYKILTGRPPHHGAKSWLQAHQLALECQIADPEEVAIGRAVPPRLCRITMKALSRDPADRYPSVYALQEEVEDFLRGGGWFATVTFAAGTTIIQEGDIGDRAYIIRSGQCEVYRDTPEGRQPLRHIGPGGVFGETAVLTAQPRNACVAALSDVEAFIITRESLDRELDRNAWLAIIVRALAERFREVAE